MESSLIKSAIKNVHKKFDASLFNDLMENFKSEINTMKEDSDKIRVRGVDSESKAIEVATAAKRLNKAIDKARMSAKRPYLDFNKEIDSLVRPAQKILTEIEGSSRKKCKDYRNKLLEKQREAEKKEEKKENIKIGGLNVKAPQKSIAPATGKVESFSGGSGSYSKKIVPHLIDIKKVPAEYLSVNWSAVKASMKSGITEIPGIEMREEIDMKIRS